MLGTDGGITAKKEWNTKLQEDLLSNKKSRGECSRG